MQRQPEGMEPGSARARGKLAERNPEAWSGELFGFKRKRFWASESKGNGLRFLRKEGGPGVRTRSAWP